MSAAVRTRAQVSVLAAMDAMTPVEAERVARLVHALAVEPTTHGKVTAAVGILTEAPGEVLTGAVQ